MKRTTIYLESGLELRLKSEAARRKQPMAELVREAVEVYLSPPPADGPPGAGAFASGHRDTADRVDAVLADTGFGGAANPPARRHRSPKRRAPPASRRSGSKKRRA